MNRSSKTKAVEPDAQTAQKRALFTRLVLRHERELAHAARRLCRGDEERAQDFIQDTLVRAYRACLSGYFREEGNHYAWLLRIVTNLYINDYNHRRRWEAGVGLDSLAVGKKLEEASQRAALAETPAALLMAATLDETVEQALAALPEKLRLCTMLVDMEGLDYAQAAQSLGVPIGTVRSRLSRSRRLLKPLLREYVPEWRQVSA